MSKFTDNIPPEMLAHPNVARLAKVFDGLYEHKTTQLAEMDGLVDPRRTFNTDFLNKYLDDLGMLQYIVGFPMLTYQRLILNAFDIFNKKGTLEGLRTYAWCFDADVSVDASGGWADRFLTPSHETDGYLPADEELTSELLYLFAGDEEDFFNSYTVNLVGPYFYIPALRTLVATAITRMLPMYSDVTSNLTVNFFSHGVPYGSITTNPYLYNP